MRSVADELRRRDRRQLEALSAGERLALSFRLGEEALATYCTAHGVDRATAIGHFRRRRQASRQPSRCIEELLD